MCTKLKLLDQIGAKTLKSSFLKRLELNLSAKNLRNLHVESLNNKWHQMNLVSFLMNIWLFLWRKDMKPLWFDTKTDFFFEIGAFGINCLLMLKDIGFSKINFCNFPGWRNRYGLNYLLMKSKCCRIFGLNYSKFSRANKNRAKKSQRKRQRIRHLWNYL